MLEANEAPMRAAVSMSTPHSKVILTPNSRVILAATGATARACERIKPPMKANLRGVAPWISEVDRYCERNTP